MILSIKPIDLVGIRKNEATGCYLYSKSYEPDRLNITNPGV